ncbi:MAG TPA: lipid-binding SYLF domain-containing protein [Bryobacteraceae bacterium]|nr:lipid-binding SYLF domain-containing protein [Bryobacteraceae bacterium]
MKAIAIVAASFLMSGAFAAETTPGERLNRAATVIDEVMASPDRSIPQDLLNRAECVIVVPKMKKAAFVVGGEYGHGFAACRKPDGVGWAAPAAVRLEGGSVGFQIGGEEADIVMLVMNREGMRKLMNDKVTLGADASVAAGPVGREANAQTDAAMHAEILTWSRARGAFAGIALKGATIRPADKENTAIYGQPYTMRQIVMNHVAPTPETRPLIAALDRYSSRSSSSAADRMAK